MERVNQNRLRWTYDYCGLRTTTLFHDIIYFLRVVSRLRKTIYRRTGVRIRSLLLYIVNFKDEYFFLLHFSWEHRASTRLFHRIRFCAVLFVLSLVMLVFANSFSIDLLQVCWVRRVLCLLAGSTLVSRAWVLSIATFYA